MKITLLLSLLLVSLKAFSASGITYHGRIMRSDNTPFVSPTTIFHIRIKSPGAEGCLMWEEFQTKNLSTTGGVFTVTIGDTDEPTRVPVPIANPLTGGNFTLPQVFSNRSPYTSGLNCDDASGTYIPASTHGRSFEIRFRENLTAAWEELPPASINYVPLAYNSIQLEGYRASEFLKIDPLAVYTPLSAGQVNTLVDIIAGTNTQYLRPSTAFSGDISGNYNSIVVDGIQGRAVSATAPGIGQVLKFDGTSWVPSADDSSGSASDASYAAKGVVQIDTDLAVSGLTISGGVLSLPNVGTAGTYGSASQIPVITTDTKGRVTGVVNTAVDDASKLPLLGGTMTGSINMGLQNITNATSVAATNFSGRNLILNDNDTNTATVRAPADITTSYALTLPVGAPQNGYVLSTDGTGQLSWIAASAGSLTGISSTNSYLTVDNTIPASPALTVNVGVLANTVAAGDDARIIGAVQQTAYATDVAGAACSVTQTPYWNTISDTWSCQNIDFGANGGFVNNGNSFAGLATLGTNDANALAFETAGTTKMTLSTTGRLGINNTTPQSFLDIAVPTGDTTTDAYLALSTHSGTYAQPSLLLLGTRPNMTSGWGSAGVIGWRVGSVSGNGGNGGMESDFQICNRSGTATENCRLHMDFATGNLNVGGSNAGLHMGSRLNVRGNMTVGTSWSSWTTFQAAPTDSLIVEGMIGAGLTTPATALDVNGAISARGMAAPALAPAGQGRIYFDSTSNTFRISQNGSAYQEVTVGGFMNGGNSFGAAGTLGTNDNFGMNFETNGTARMAITNDGSVGIGSLTPTAFFDVQGGTSSTGSGKAINIVAQNALQSGVPSYNGADVVLTAGRAYNYGSPGNIVLNAAPTGGGAATLGGNIFLNSRTNIGWTAGNVAAGIIQHNPFGYQPTLSVGFNSGDTPAGITTISANSTSNLNYGLVGLGARSWGGSGTPLQNGDLMPGFMWGGLSTPGLGSGTVVGAGIYGQVDGAVSSLNLPTSIVFQTSLNNGAGLSEKMRISSAGLVGIGTDLPATALDVNGAISNRGLASAPANAPAGQGRIYFSTAENKFKVSQNGGAYTDLVTAGGAGDITNGGNSFGSAATIGTNDNNDFSIETNNVPRMVFKNDGYYIGVRNSNPIYGFDLTGPDMNQLVARFKGGSWNDSQVTIEGGNGSGRPVLEFSRPGDSAMQLLFNSSGLLLNPSNNINSPSVNSGVFTTTGRLGIKTTSPTSELDINGAVTQRGLASAPAVSPAGQGRIYFDSASNKFRVSQDGGAYTDLVPAGGAGDILNGGNTTGAAITMGTNDAQNLVLETSGSARLTVRPDGRVGINTPTPSANLEVFGTTGVGESIVAGSDFDNLIRVYSNSATGRTGLKIDGRGGGGFNSWILHNGNADQNFYITEGNNINAATQRFTIAQGGNVGVGTTSPTSKFQVQGAASAGPVDYSMATFQTSLNKGLTFGYDNTNEWSTVYSREVGSSPRSIAFFSQNTSPNIPSMIVAYDGFSTGRVGIGTATPRAALDVNGAILSKPATGNGTSTINFAGGNLQFTNSDCAAYAFHNLKDGGAYTFAVKGTAVATCSFTAFSDAGVTPLTVKMPPDHGATTTGKHTLYNLLVMGSDVYVAWTPGY